MKKFKTATIILRVAANWWFFLSCFHFLLMLSFLVTRKEAYKLQTDSNSYYSLDNKIAHGYPILASFSLHMPADTMISYKGINQSGTFNNNDGLSPFIDSFKNSILADTSYTKEYFYSKWVVQPGANYKGSSMYSVGAKDNYAMFDSLIIQKHTDVYVNVDRLFHDEIKVNLSSPDKFKSFVFGLQYWLGLLIMLFVTYQASRLFTQINKEKNFIPKLYKRIYIIGLSLLAVNLLNFICSLVYVRWYGAILLQTATPWPSDMKGNNYFAQFNPALDFNLTLFLFALILLVTATLFKYAYLLEQEKQLTI